jgi:hypothetical protein
MDFGLMVCALAGTAFWEKRLIGKLVRRECAWGAGSWASRCSVGEAAHNTPALSQRQVESFSKEIASVILGGTELSLILPKSKYQGLPFLVDLSWAHTDSQRVGAPNSLAVT